MRGPPWGTAGANALDRASTDLSSRSLPFSSIREETIVVKLLSMFTQWLTIPYDHLRAPPGADVGRKRLMDRRGDGVPVIRRESRELSGRLPEYALVGDAELQLVIWAARP